MKNLLGENLIKKNLMNKNLIKKLTNKGSITLEAAIVMPLYMFAIIAILSIMQMLNTYMNIQLSVYKAGSEIALYLHAKEKISKVNVAMLADLINAAAGDSYAKSEIEKGLNNNKNLKKFISNDISLSYSKFKAEGNSTDIIDLIAVYKLRPEANFFGISDYTIISRARLHPWTGYDISNVSDDEHEERIVYITETGEVYHLSRSCTYLDLSIVSVNSTDISNLRNAGGAKYYACEICGGGTGDVYITGQGNRYHNSITCSGLKRTIIEIPISKVGNKRACSRCGG